MYSGCYFSRFCYSYHNVGRHILCGINLRNNFSGNLWRIRYSVFFFFLIWEKLTIDVWRNKKHLSLMSRLKNRKGFYACVYNPELDLCQTKNLLLKDFNRFQSLHQSRRQSFSNQQSLSNQRYTAYSLMEFIHVTNILLRLYRAASVFIREMMVDVLGIKLRKSKEDLLGIWMLALYENSSFTREAGFTFHPRLCFIFLLYATRWGQVAIYCMLTFNIVKLDVHDNNWSILNSIGKCWTILLLILTLVQNRIKC